jgi:hypothetical protein
VIRKNAGVTLLNTNRAEKMIVETFVGLKLIEDGAAIPVKEIKATGAGADTLSIEGKTAAALKKVTVTKGKINISTAADPRLIPRRWRTASRLLKLPPRVWLLPQDSRLGPCSRVLPLLIPGRFYNRPNNNIRHCMERAGAVSGRV